MRYRTGALPSNNKKDSDKKKISNSDNLRFFGFKIELLRNYILGCESFLLFINWFQYICTGKAAARRRESTKIWSGWFIEPKREVQHSRMPRRADTLPSEQSRRDDCTPCFLSREESDSEFCTKDFLLWYLKEDRRAFLRSFKGYKGLSTRGGGCRKSIA